MARKKESLFWDRVKPRLAGLDPVRIECDSALGVPDVNCTLGWIELKQVQEKDLPKRATTPLRIPHFTPQQRAWLARRSHFGGKCWVLILIGKDWLLIEGLTAATHLGKVTVKETYSRASHVWKDYNPSKDQLQEALRG